MEKVSESIANSVKRFESGFEEQEGGAMGFGIIYEVQNRTVSVGCVTRISTHTANVTVDS